MPETGFRTKRGLRARDPFSRARRELIQTCDGRGEMKVAQTARREILREHRAFNARAYRVPSKQKLEMIQASQ